MQILFTCLMLFVSACSSPQTQAAEKEFEDFNPGNFDRPTTIDNKWFPLKPGTQLTYEGQTVDAGEAIPHRVVFTVTDLTKVIDGVRAVVIWELDYSNEQLDEAEIALFAQDNDGVVWHLGQYPEVYEAGKLVEAPAWIHGIEDARAGITMKADPKLGGPSYSQGWGPAVGWTDRARVDQIGQQTCVPLKCFENILVTAENSKKEPTAFQLKYYAAGIGTIKVSWKGDDETKEELELIDIVQLSPEALGEVRTSVLEMERRAYEVSKNVYAHTLPVEYPEGTPAIDISEISLAEPAQ